MSTPTSEPTRRWATGVRVCRIAGIPIVLSWSWLLSVLIVVVLATPLVRQVVPGTSGAVAAAVAALLGVLLGVGVLIHELGHCLAARIFGVPVVEVRLYLLGGVSELGRAPRGPREEALVAAAGPGLSALLAGLCFLLVGGTQRHTVGWLLAVELALSNAVVAIFNFIPALPLDGGRVLRAGVWGLTGRRRWGTVAAAIGGYLVAIGLGVWGVVEIAGPERAALLQGGIAIGMAVFVGVGALAEQRADRAVHWPQDQRLAALAHPVVQLPAEVPVAMALQAAGGRAVLLTRLDGAAAGWLDESGALALAGRDPRAPAGTVARPIPPEAIVLADDDPAELIRRARTSGLTEFLLIDSDGAAAGMLPVPALTRILAEHTRA